MSINRAWNVEHALTSARLSDVRPSEKFLELADQYKMGNISAAELVLKMKKHHEHSIR
ncbi:hypothetical protein [Pseudomonas sp. PDM19]|uniref:antitoxin VbhA family protein n=1 Tax=Pseudomonas sp. PDM19 TaxID=2769272 RepID=UPI0017864F11|nr:hypothetical protein [Pseudomonas sp. PDM19]